MREQVWMLTREGLPEEVEPGELWENEQSEKK